MEEWDNMCVERRDRSFRLVEKQIKSMSDDEFDDLIDRLLKESPVSKKDKSVERVYRGICYEEFMNTKMTAKTVGSSEWKCCGDIFTSRKEFAIHYNSPAHKIDVISNVTNAIKAARKRCMDKDSLDLPVLGALDQAAIEMVCGGCDSGDEVRDYIKAGTKDSEYGVLLYYKFASLAHLEYLSHFHRELCDKLGLKGKLRISDEGVNITVGGLCRGLERYVLFFTQKMKVEVGRAVEESLRSMSLDVDDFKVSRAEDDSFTELSVKVVDELVTMGRKYGNAIPDGGTHLSPEKFHEMLLEFGNETDTVLLDLRNYYEWKIGRFKIENESERNVLLPDIRKFSYFPEYFEENIEMFRGKKLLMCCTGGIRCERSSQFIKDQGVCKEIYQLEGGIHKYMQKYGREGLFAGKLYVFDERQSLSCSSLSLDNSSKSAVETQKDGELEGGLVITEDCVSDVILTRCKLCGNCCDRYEFCSRPECRLLVLCCRECSSKGVFCCSDCEFWEGSEPMSHSIANLCMPGDEKMNQSAPKPGVFTCRCVKDRQRANQRARRRV